MNFIAIAMMIASEDRFSSERSSKVDSQVQSHWERASEQARFRNEKAIKRLLRGGSIWR